MRYDCIINHPHHVSVRHPHMSLNDRAAQFAPFAALTGHSEAIAETARYTDIKTELDSEKIKQIDEKIKFLAEHIKDKLKVTITCFRKDNLKDGGAYIDIVGTVKRINDVESILILEENNITIKFEDIYDINTEESSWEYFL